MDVPAARYRPSERAFAEELLPIEYPKGDAVRKVDQNGRISFQNRVVKVGRGFVAERVGLRPTPIDGVYDIYFCHQCIKQLDLGDYQEP